MATPNDTTKDAAVDVSSNQTQESPWKKMKPTEDANMMAQQEKIMKAENVSHSKYVPAQLERHLEFMQTNDDGHVILGCSNLTGRFWIGSLWYYRNPEEAPSVEKALTGVDFDNGLIDGFFVNSKNIIVAEDNGCVEQVRLSFSNEESASFFYLERLKSVTEHDDLISSIVKTHDGTQIITSSYDNSIVVSETETLRLLSRIPEAHTDIIYNIAVSEKNQNILVSAANDGFVSLWDLRTIRQSNSSHNCIYEDINLKPTCVQFLPDNEHNVLIGNQGGQVGLYDIRKPKECIAKDSTGEKSVTRIKYSSQKESDVSATFAVCYEATPVRVLELNSQLTAIKQRYENKDHEDFVRDVLWTTTKNGFNCRFYSCGWDHKVISHKF